ncbi:hypothetical protein JCM11251_000924 [Rhodosporidiobolus azoricus]
MPSERYDDVPAVPADFPLLASIRRRAFADSPLNPFLFANVTDEAYEAHTVGQLARWHASDAVEVRKAVVKETGQLVGLAAWALPSTRKNEDSTSVPKSHEGEDGGRNAPDDDSWPEGTDVVWADGFFSSMENVSVEEPHLGLSLIVVDPSEQRGGAGAALLEWGIRYADEHDVPIYLEATDKGAGLYERFGLEKYRPPIRSEQLDDYVMYPMRRLRPACPPQITLLPAVPEDFPTLASLRLRAFKPTSSTPSPFLTTFFPNVTDEAHTAFSAKRLEKAYKSKEGAIWKAVDGQGQVLGLAVWAWRNMERREEDHTKGEKDDEEEEEKTWPEETNVEAAEAFFAEVEKSSQVEEPNLHLRLLVVDPDRQRTGAGSKLLQWGCKAADEKGVAMYLEATEVAMPLNKRSGYVKFGTPVNGRGEDKVILYPMCRPANSASSCAAASISSTRPLSCDQILPVSPSDYPRLLEIETAAFSPSASYRALFSSVTPAAALEHATTKRFPQALLDPQKRIIKVVRDGEIVGWAQWEVPLREGEERLDLKKAGLEEVGFPEGTDLEEANALFPKFDLGIEEPHYHLSILVVHPANRRTGAARALLQWGIEQADRDGKDIYLRSSPEARAVYPKFGFSHFGSPIVGGTPNQLVVYPMRRPARRLPASILPSPVALTNGVVPSFASCASSLTAPGRLVDIFPASTKDLTRLATIDSQAFQGSVISRLVFPNVTSATHIAQLTQRLQKALDHPYKAVMKAVLRETGEIIGLALWELAKPAGFVEHKEEQSAWPDGTDVALAEEFLRARRGFKPDHANYHLSLLAVEPSKQRTGAGAALLKWGFKKADEAGVPIYLNASDVAVPLYARHGFQMHPLSDGPPCPNRFLQPPSTSLSSPPCTVLVPRVMEKAKRAGTEVAVSADGPLYARLGSKAFA